MNEKKSLITEAMITQAIASVAVIVFQLIQSQQVSQVAITAAVAAIAPIVLRAIHKKRGG